MGLDSVELILELEESFNISFSDEEASRMLTVGECYEAILKKLPSHEEKFCLSAVTFYKVRKALMSAVDLTRSEIRPATDLASLIPAKERRKVWRDMKSSLQLRLPSLAPPESTFPLALICAFVGTIVLCKYTSLTSGLLLLLPELFLFYMFFAWIGSIAFGTTFSEDIQTVRGFTKKVLAMNFGKLSANVAEHYHEEVWQSIQILVVEQLGVDIKDVTKEARFVADLGIS